MWGGGFWGTHREEQWRRRKEKEHEREDQIRRQEQGVQQNLRNQFEHDLQSKDNVLKLTKNLLSVSRMREQDGTLASMSQDDGGGGDGDKDTLDQKPPAKRPRVEDVEANPPLQHDPIQENLLCMTYAMYDTLFGTESFNPSSFCDFLIQSGARSVAEEIALAAIERTGGKAPTVRYVLEELVPHSFDAENLAKRVKDVLKDDPSRRTNAIILDEGKEVLLNWQAKHGNKEDAFYSALQITDEITRVRTCLPLLEGNGHRIKMLKDASPHVCSPVILRVFSDSEWPGFLGAIKLPGKLDYYSGFRPAWRVMLNYAAKSKSSEAGRKVMEEMIRAYVGREMTGGLPGPSAVRNEGEAAGQIAHLRQRNCDKMIDLLTKVNGKVQEDQMQNDLDSLSIDWLEILSNFFKKSTQLEQSACAVNHRDLMITYRCTSCRETIGHAANVVGFVMGIRKHPTTKKHAYFAAIGLSGGARMALEKAKTHPLGVNAILTGLSTEIVDSLAAAST